MKHFKNTTALSLSLLASALLLTGCLDSSSSSSNKKETRNLDLEFRALNTTLAAGDQDVTSNVCATTLNGIGTKGTNASVDYMAFYLSEVKLITSSGQKIPVTLDDNRSNQEAGAALVDFRNLTGPCNGTSRQPENLVFGSYEHSAGTTYKGLEFTLGLPPALNHGDPFSNPNGILSKSVDMHWNWLGGFRYLRFDIAPDGGVTNAAGGTASRWNVHLGATVCDNGGEANTVPPTSGSCTNHNLPAIQLSGFDPEVSKVGVDIAALFAGSDITQDSANPVGCMSGVADPECDEIFARLGLEHPQQAGGFSTPIQQVIFKTLAN